MVEAGAAPDLVPGVARDQALEVGVELARAGERAVDPLVAEDARGGWRRRGRSRRCDRQAVFVAHGAAPFRKARARGGRAAPWRQRAGAACRGVDVERGVERGGIDGARARARRAAARAAARLRASHATTSSPAARAPSPCRATARAARRRPPRTPCRAGARCCRACARVSTSSPAQASARATSAPWVSRKSDGHSASSACHSPRPRSCDGRHRRQQRRGVMRRAQARRRSRSSPRPGSSSAASPTSRPVPAPTARRPRRPRPAPAAPDRGRSCRASRTGRRPRSRAPPSRRAGRARRRRQGRDRAARRAGARPPGPCRRATRACRPRRRTAAAAPPPVRAQGARAPAPAARAQATILKPKLITCAGCISVRASIGVRRWARASAISDADEAREIGVDQVERLPASTITIAVSMTSWLVLP